MLKAYIKSPTTESNDYFEDYITVGQNKDYNDCDILTFFNSVVHNSLEEIIFEDFSYFLSLGQFKDFLLVLISKLRQDCAINIISEKDKNIEVIFKELRFSNFNLIDPSTLKKTTKKEVPNKIFCFVTTYFDFENIKKSMDFITDYNDRLEIIALENKSDYTEKDIKPYLLDLLKKEKISKYYAFEDNVGANALKACVFDNFRTLLGTEYIMLTDGDLTVEDKNWLNEEIEILKNNPEVLAVGMQLDPSNLPSKELYPDVDSWRPKSEEIIGKNYCEGLTGNCFLLFRTADLLPLLLRTIDADKPFLDGFFHQYCYKILKMKWATTKNAKAYHLTWDVYSDLEHPYTKWKRSKSYEEIWWHKNTCNFKVYTKEMLS